MLKSNAHPGQSRKTKGLSKRVKKAQRAQHNENEISSSHSKDVETVRNHQSSCEFLLEVPASRLDSEADPNSRSPVPESPAPMSPLKSRFNGLTPLGTQYN